MDIARTTADRHRNDVHSAIQALLHSLWAELGAVRAERRHPTWIIDPEPLILFTPILAAADPELLAAVRTWIGAHRRWLSMDRLAGWTASVPPEVSEAARGYVGDAPPRGGAPLGSAAGWSRVLASLATLGAARPRSASSGDDARLDARSAPRRSAAPTLDNSAPWPSPSGAAAAAAADAPLQRPGAWRLRARALFGVGARAEVIAVLLAHRGSPLILERFAVVRVAPRNVRVVLSALADAGVVRETRHRRVTAWQLVDPDPLARATTLPEGAVFVYWEALFGWLLLVRGAMNAQDDDGQLRQVALAAPALLALAQRLPVPPLLPTGDAFVASFVAATRHLAGLPVHSPEVP